jgi:hypothetical protein
VLAVLRPLATGLVLVGKDDTAIEFASTRNNQPV